MVLVKFEDEVLINYISSIDGALINYLLSVVDGELINYLLSAVDVVLINSHE